MIDVQKFWSYVWPYSMVSIDMWLSSFQKVFEKIVIKIKMEAVCSLEMVSAYKSAWCYDPDQHQHDTLLLLL
jgi:hypothetical protein